MTAAFFRISSEAELHTVSRSALFSFRGRASSSSRGRPCPGNAGNPVPADSRARCIRRYNTFSLIPKSTATRLTGFPCFSAGATAPALNSVVYTRRSLSFFPVFFSPSGIFPAYLCVYQLG
jgi:hypothetical protein